MTDTFKDQIGAGLEEIVNAFAARDPVRTIRAVRMLGELGLSAAPPGLSVRAAGIAREVAQDIAFVRALQNEFASMIEDSISQSVLSDEQLLERAEHAVEIIRGAGAPEEEKFE